MRSLLNTQSIILESGILVLSTLVLFIILSSHSLTKWQWVLSVAFLVINIALSITHIKLIIANKKSSDSK